MNLSQYVFSKGSNDLLPLNLLICSKKFWLFLFSIFVFVFYYLLNIRTNKSSKRLSWTMARKTSSILLGSEDEANEKCFVIQLNLFQRIKKKTLIIWVLLFQRVKSFDDLYNEMKAFYLSFAQFCFNSEDFSWTKHFHEFIMKIIQKKRMWY